MNHYDLVIVGAGLVGTSLLIALQSQGLRIAIFEKKLPAEIEEKSMDRPLSLAYGSYAILKKLGVWEEIAPAASPIKKVEVSEVGSLGAVCFEASAMDVEALGYVVPISLLQKKLYQKALQTELSFILSERIEKIEWQENKNHIQFIGKEGENEITCSLLIACDGTHSSVRNLISIEVNEKKIDEIAWVSTITLEQPHSSVAYERFSQEGVFAILPLFEKNKVQLVWTLSKNLLEKNKMLSSQELQKKIESIFLTRLPKIKSITSISQFPLTSIIARQQIKKGVILLGNAAHTLYPIAAQGFNLSLRDVTVLSEILINAMGQKKLNDYSILTDYLKLRTEDQNNTMRMTNGLSAIFGLDFPFSKKLRSFGLLGIALFSPLKKKIARQGMGVSK